MQYSYNDSVIWLNLLMKIESVSVNGQKSESYGVGRKFIIISISLTIFLNTSVLLWFFFYIKQNGIDKFIIK